MPKKVIEKTKNDQNLTVKGRDVTIGNFDGKATVLLQILVQEGIFQVEEEQYSRLIEIFSKQIHEKPKAKAKALIKECKTILKEQVSIANMPSLLRILGDQFSSSENENHLFVMMLYQACIEKGIDLSIVITDHTAYLVAALEAGNRKEGLFAKPRAFPESFDINKISSFDNLKCLVKMGIISASALTLLMQKYYFNQLALVDFNMYCMDGKNRTIVYSNHQTAISNLQELADKGFSVFYHSTDQKPHTFEFDYPVETNLSKKSKFENFSHFISFMTANDQYSGLVMLNSIVQNALLKGMFSRLLGEENSAIQNVLFGKKNKKAKQDIGRYQSHDHQLAYCNNDKSLLIAETHKKTLKTDADTAKVKTVKDKETKEVTEFKIYHTYAGVNCKAKPKISKAGWINLPRFGIEPIKSKAPKKDSKPIEIMKGEQLEQKNTAPKVIEIQEKKAVTEKKTVIAKESVDIVCNTPSAIEDSNTPVITQPNAKAVNDKSVVAAYNKDDVDSSISNIFKRIDEECNSSDDELDITDIDYSSDTETVNPNPDCSSIFLGIDNDSDASDTDVDYSSETETVNLNNDQSSLPLSMDNDSDASDMDEYARDTLADNQNRIKIIEDALHAIKVTIRAQEEKISKLMQDHKKFLDDRAALPMERAEDDKKCRSQKAADIAEIKKTKRENRKELDRKKQENAKDEKALKKAYRLGMHPREYIDEGGVYENVPTLHWGQLNQDGTPWAANSFFAIKDKKPRKKDESKIASTATQQKNSTEKRGEASGRQQNPQLENFSQSRYNLRPRQK